MISFIIIGRNEGWKLIKCIKSVFDTIEVNSLSKYEIIYVDSKSTDDSIKNAKEFNNIKIFELTNDYNAAIARNAGAKESSGEVLFFIDGDMEIIPSFLPLVYNPQDGLLDNFVSGNWINYFYDINDKIIEKENFQEMEKDSIEKVTGGLFLIKKAVWEKVGGMNSKFKKSQDIDLGLRLAKNKFYLLRKKEIAAIHHTIEYMDKKRKWKDLFKWHHLYGKSFLYRTHIFNYHVYHRIIRHDYSMIALVFICISSIFFSICLYLFIAYFGILFYRSKYKIENIAFYFLRDIISIIGFIAFHPKKLNSNYTKISPSNS